jgi:RimJ/RimL family protein N-acetyltransferase
MSSSKKFPENGWPRPEARDFAGRFITLTPMDVGGDVDELWHVSHATDEAQELWRYLPCGPFSEASEMAAFCRDWQAKPDVLIFTVRDNATQRRVGSISIMNVRPEHGVAELGFIWYAPAAQRTKTNTEANYLLLRHCFEDLHYRRMEWKCNAANERSHRAALRLGYRYEGTFRQHMVVKELNRNTDWFSMLDEEWPAARSAMERWLYGGDPSPRASLRETP